MISASTTGLSNASIKRKREILYRLTKSPPFIFTCSQFLICFWLTWLFFRSVGLLAASSALVSSTQLFGEPIQCDLVSDVHQFWKLRNSKHLHCSNAFSSRSSIWMETQKRVDTYSAERRTQSLWTIFQFTHLVYLGLPPILLSHLSPINFLSFSPNMVFLTRCWRTTAGCTPPSTSLPTLRVTVPAPRTIQIPLTTATTSGSPSSSCSRQSYSTCRGSSGSWWRVVSEQYFPSHCHNFFSHKCDCCCCCCCCCCCYF